MGCRVKVPVTEEVHRCLMYVVGVAPQPSEFLKFSNSPLSFLRETIYDDVTDHTADVTSHKPDDDEQSQSDSESPGRGVKEDLSEITKTLTRQFWGVASFLAPPPPEQSQSQSEPSDPEEDAREPITGIRRDFAEIGGRFRSGIEKLSNVSEITKLATNLLQLSPEDEEVVKAVGVTEEVVAFVRDITLHPETWLDFPLPDDDDDDEDFELSDAQQEHALTVESLAPRLAALRIELCPGYMSESSFWKIYFVLLHPRLEPHAAELLSTPEPEFLTLDSMLALPEKMVVIVKARASLTHELKSRSNPQPKKEEGSSNVFPYSEHKPAPQEESSSQLESVPLEITTTQSTAPALSADVEAEKHSISSEVQIVDKSVIQEEPRTETKSGGNNMSFKNVIEDKDDDDADDWLKEDHSENVAGTGTTTIPIDNDEDVSFSDLEEDDADAPTNDKNGSDSSTKDSRDWVQLGSGPGAASGQNSETKETNDWLDVDDIDVA
ncbi:BSD-like protein [Artemisia annua]|uniref:BSD-like protein n=1 Tax=Artemisia annua TaxID=35608 RepID=A0A2U1NSC3_ARTAN|nr:BSD-like protein [Artemisia annua]